MDVHLWHAAVCSNIQGVPKITQHLLILSISNDLVTVPFVHLYDVVGKLLSHNCGKIQTKYLNGHCVITFLPKVLKNRFAQVLMFR